MPFNLISNDGKNKKRKWFEKNFALKRILKISLK